MPPSPDLPDSLVGLAPVLADPVGERPHADPEPVGNRLAVLVVEIDGVHDLAGDVELKLPRSIVPHPHRAGAPIAVEVVERRFRDVDPSVDPVEHLESPLRIDLAAP